VRDFHDKDMTAGACIELYEAGSWLAPPSDISSVLLQKSKEKQLTVGAILTAETIVRVN